MRRVVIFLMFCLLALTTHSVFAQSSVPQGQWRWYQTHYKLPQLEGLSAPIQIGYFVTHENPRVLDHVIRLNSQDFRMNEDGLIIFNNQWRLADRLLEYTVVVHLEQDSFVITTHLAGGDSELVTRGRLPLTDTELQLANIITHSKGPEAQVKNEELEVSDVDLARTLIFASYHYNIPLNLFVALICQETKFNAGSTDRSSIKGIAQLSEGAVDDVENIYFKRPVIAEKLRQHPEIRPNREHWTHYVHNLLYAAAYLDHLFHSIKKRIPQAQDQEVWKFVCVWYNFGMGAGQSAWERAGKPTSWNKNFSDQLDEGEKRMYSGSIHFYMFKMAQGETNLFQYQPSMERASERINFVRQFNNPPNP